MIKLDDSLKDSLVSKLDKYQSIVQASISTCKAYDSDENTQQIQLLREPFLNALTILEGNTEKYQFCFKIALKRSVYHYQELPFNHTTINYIKLRAEIVTLAILLEQKDTEDYLKEQTGTFDKAMEKAGFEVRDVEPDKLPPKRKK